MTADTITNANTPQLKTTQKWIDAYIALDMKKISGLLSKNYKHETSPKTLGIPEETKDEYLQRLGGMIPSFIKLDPFIIHEVLETPGKVVMHSTDIIPTVYDTTLTYEAVYTVSFVEEDGELKLSRCKEFIDSQEYGAFAAKIAKIVAKGGPAS